MPAPHTPLFKWQHDAQAELEAMMHVRPQCFGDSVSGTRTFDDDGNLLDQEICRLKETLSQMYKRETRRREKPPAHPALADLVDPETLELERLRNRD
jgi:hypothetical protein